MIRFTDEAVQEAFDILDGDAHSRARAAYEFADKHLKVILAKARLAANGKTQGERDDSAHASPEYQQALRDFHLVAEQYFAAKDRREAASARVEAWRTQQSDLRAMGRVA